MFAQRDRANTSQFISLSTCLSWVVSLFASALALLHIVGYMSYRYLRSISSGEMDNCIAYMHENLIM